jgi:protein-disulfide isomerase
LQFSAVTVAESPSADSPTDSAVVAVIGTQKVTAAEIRSQTPDDFDRQEKGYRAQLRQLQITHDRARDKLLRQKLGDYLDKRSLELESSATGKSTGELLAGVQARPVTDEEARTLYMQYKDRINQTYEEAEPDIKKFLAARHLSEATRALYDELRSRHHIAVALDPFRVKVENSGPVRGNSKARVTIVEFADFQCPFCSRAEDALRSVLAHHPGDVRIVFRHLPLESLHPNAMAAARAGVCAARQSKFWEMHDAMFANQSKLAEPELKETAQRLGIDGDKFSACMTDAETAASVATDVDAAAELGISGTPSFFVNGRPMEGVVPEADFEAVISEELTRSPPDHS